MRTSLGSLLVVTAAMACVPAVASAQTYYPPMPIGAVPPHVYIHQRVQWHVRHMPPPVVVLPVAPPVWIPPAPPSPPPPPVYVAPPPAPPIYVQPQPVYQYPQYAPPPPVYYTSPPAPVYVQRPAPVVVQPQWQSRFGLGVTGEGLASFGGIQNGDFSGLGFMGQLRYRAARHLGLELMGGYEKSTQGSLDRSDVPVTFGLLIHILGPEYAVSPYLVGATGLNFADLTILDAPTHKIEDSRTQLVAQAGAGLEVRLGQHFALNGDVRLEGRWNLNDASEAVKNTTSVDGKPVQPIQDSTGVRVGVGATMYF